MALPRIRVRSQTGIEVGEVALAPEIFEAQVNVPVMHQVVVAQMNARRAGTHDTKTRGEVSGGGKKPWRQKGTGRARQGSSRAPHWEGGGVVWGPHPRDHSQKVPRKMRMAALRSALSDRARDGKIVVVDGLSFEAPKTREAQEILNLMGVEGKVLLVLDDRDEVVEKSFRNLIQVHMITVDQLNTYDVIARDWILFTRQAIEKLNARAGAIGKRDGRIEQEAAGGEAS